MLNVLRTKTSIFRLLTMMGFILAVIAPVGSWVLAENGMRNFSSANTIYTSEFSIENPEGMAYLPDHESLVIWGNKSENMIALGKETTSKTNFAQDISNPLGVSFDNHSNSLFVLGMGNTELHKIKIDGKNTQASQEEATRFNIGSLELSNVQGMTIDPATGQLFILDASKQRLLVMSLPPANGFNNVNAMNNGISHISLAALSESSLRGVAFNPTNDHLYLGDPDKRKVYEVTKTGEWISTYDISSLHFENPAAMLFAPSQDSTDDPNIMALYILDSGQLVQSSGSSLSSDQRNTSQKGQIVELSLQAPAALPPGTTLLPSTLVRTFSTSNSAWNPSSPDPAGVDYWPLTGRLLIADSEVDEMPAYFQGKNVFLSTTSGALTGTCSTTSFTGEPTGVAINPINNHIFFSTDFNDRVFEVSLGPDGLYCTADDTLTTTEVGSLYRITDAEDVAYGNNTLFIGGGASAEVYRIPLGSNGVLGGGDDGAMTHFDTASLGFSDLEAIGYNSDANTLFIASTAASERYLGETTTSGALIHAYDVSFMGSAGNIRSDLTYAPGSQNPAARNIYIVSRGVDNDDNRNENDGKVWEVQLSSAVIPTATPVTPVPANIQVNIGGNNVGNYQIPRLGSQRTSFPGIDSGPAEIVSTNGFSILAAMRVIWQEPGFRSSYSELMGLPVGQLSTEYWFPWYNNATPSMDQGFRIANINATGINTIQIWVGDSMLDSFSLGIGASRRVSYAIDNGPIRVVCTTCTSGERILAAMRVIWQEPGYRSSYSELMGLPKERLSTEYWFPWYNNATSSMDQGFRIANVDSTFSHTIQVRVGSTLLESFTLGAGASVRKSYSIDNGPIRIFCTDCTVSGKILAAMRVIWQEPGYRSSYSELMGLPKEQLSTEYWFPWYNNATPSIDQGFRIANVDTTAHTVKVFVGTTQVGTDIHLAAGGSTRVGYVVDNGPVRIFCSDCTGAGKILAAMRVLWQERGFRSSYSEMMGLPKEQLSTEYWFPWYNFASPNSMDQGFRIAVP